MKLLWAGDSQTHCRTKEAKGEPQLQHHKQESATQTKGRVGLMTPCTMA